MDYTKEQIQRMQQDAIMRVRDMNKRSKSQPPQNPPPKKEETERKNELRSTPPVQKQHGIFSFLEALDITKLIGENSEQALLLVLILVLMNEEKTSDWLLYALIYIML